MNKKYSLFVAVVLLIGIVAFASFSGRSGDGAKSPLEATYTISGVEYPLKDGKFEKEIAPGSASKEVVRIFGEPIYGDLDNDGDSDAVMLLQQDMGGSGTFYYAVVAINDNGKYLGTDAMLLGDRIAPQTVEIHDGKAVVNFAERKAGESFTTPPSVGRSIWIYLDVKNREIGEAVQNFEGETDSARLIQVSSPTPNEKVASPLTITGQARGYWYFEASFPIKIFDANGKQLGVAIAQAQSDWMTTEFVPFEAVLVFEKPTTSTGKLVLQKDNPSGMKAQDASISIPIKF